MNYVVLLANSDHLMEERVSGVTNIRVVEDVYVLYDASSEIVFTAPLNSVVYIKQA